MEKKMITKQNYIRIAEILNDNIIIEEMNGKEVKRGFDLYILEQLSFYFKEDNPLFDEKRFREAVLK
jgi:hypothetical protein